MATNGGYLIPWDRESYDTSPWHYNDHYRGLSLESIKAKRSVEITEHLIRGRISGPNSKIIREVRDFPRNGTKYEVQDYITGEYYTLFISDYDTSSAQAQSMSQVLSNSSYFDAQSMTAHTASEPKEWKINKNAFLGMGYAVGVDATSVQKLDHTTLSNAVASLKKEVHPKCQSCSENHPKENLDLMGRCKLKLERHNKKLGKLYREHNKKQHGNKKPV